MKSYRTDEIRNLVLLSHGGAGKTSLTEALLFNSGAINRLGRVEDSNTTSDYEPEEQRRRISINVSLIPVEVAGHKVNLIDTPGYADFVGEVCSGIRAADAALVVIDAAAGVEVGTAQAWKYAEDAGLTRLIFVNKMDRDNADFLRALSQVQTAFGNHCVALQLPIGATDAFQGVVDLLALKARLGVKGELGEVPEDLAAEAQRQREKLVEAIAETDDELLSRYLEGEEIGQEELRAGLRTAVAMGRVVPVLAGSALQNKAIIPLAESLVELVPPPGNQDPIKVINPITQADGELATQAGGPLVAQVFKTTADPYVGQLSLFRVYSGTLTSNSEVWNVNRGRAERIGQLFVMRGKNQENATELVAGDIGAVAKLAETATGDTLCHRDQPWLRPPIEFPPSPFGQAVYPHTKADLDKMGNALSRLVEDDPTLRVRRDSDTSETLIYGIGEAHLEVATEKAKRKFGVDLLLQTPKVSYKETIALPAQAEYKHKKQTGGHGQYAHVLIRLEPMSRGNGFEFAETVVGGAVPRNYIPAVEKGVRAAIQEGVVANYPVIDVKVTLYDGSFHPVDSSDMSFQIAGNMAFKKGMAQAHPTLLEPIMMLRVVVPEAFMGDVIGDLNSKRARVLGMTPEDGHSVIEAQIPLAEALHYATDLRSLTQGRGSYSVEFDHYEDVPAHIAQKIVDEAKKAEKA